MTNAMTMAVGGVLLVSAAYSQGWQPEQLLFSGNGSGGDQTITCADFPNYPMTACVFEVGPGTLDYLYESDTTNGGLTWSTPVQITNAYYAEFDCSIKPDFGPGRLWLMYSQNGGVNGGTDMKISQKTCPTCAWSAPTTIVSDGHNNWDGSLLIAANGDLIAFETLEGYGGTAPASIHYFRSTNAGVTWGPRENIITNSGTQSFPGAVQKQDGTGIIHLMFRDTYFNSAKLQIGQLWSSDYGNTWTGYSAFEYNGTQATSFEYLGSQGYPNETVIETVADRAYYWQSFDDGNTWQGPYSLTSINPSSGGTFGMGCRGPIFGFIGPNTSVYLRRYDWYTTCSGKPTT